MLKEMKRFVADHLVRRRRVRAGWRRADWSPLGDLYLEARFGYDEEEPIKKGVRLVRDHTLVSFERLATLWQQVRLPPGGR
jgi:hypothetical protein